MNYFSMFSGIGGFELAISNAYDNQFAYGSAESKPAIIDKDMRQVSKRKTISKMPWSSRRFGGFNKSDMLQPGNNTTAFCVGYSEIDKYAIKTYERHFEGHKNYGNATTIDSRELPGFDLLVGGFPCQAFSIAGKRKGFDDTRGTLFFDIARILADKKPGHLVLENVKGLLSHNSGKTFQTILRVLADLGYTVEWQVLNSKNFGVPQNRERIYIVGHLRNRCFRKILPFRRNIQKTASVFGYISEEDWPNRHEQIRRTYNTDGAMPTIPTGTGGGVMTKIYQEPRIRRLTPLECERLQGFPDNWTKEGVEMNCNGKLCAAGKQDACLGHFVEMSDTQRYKQCGNAVTVNVVQEIIKNLIDCFTVDNSIDIKEK